MPPGEGTVFVESLLSDGESLGVWQGRRDREKGAKPPGGRPLAAGDKEQREAGAERTWPGGGGAFFNFI